MKPADVSKCDEVFVWQKLYEEEPHKSIYYKFNIGDQVRISKARRTFKKGYLPNWTEEVFTITKRVPRRPPVYKIADHDSDEVEGVFYEEELQNVTKTQDDFYRVIIFISVYHVSYLEQSASFVRSFFASKTKTFNYLINFFFLACVGVQSFDMIQSYFL